MKPAPFDYVRADSVEHAVAQLAEANGDGEGKVIAGGQSLMPLLALRLAQPSVLVDINRVPGLDGISTRPGGGLRIGALTRHRALAAQGKHPLLAEAARWSATRPSDPRTGAARTPTPPSSSSCLPAWPAGWGTARRLAWARELAGLAPLSLAYAKKAINQPDSAELGKDFDACWASDDAAEGQRARAAKRPPRFRGR